MPTLREYIEALEAIEWANHELVLEVEKWMPARGRHSAPMPVIAYARKFTRGRDVVSGGPAVGGSFWNERDSQHQKGPAVVRV